MNKTQIEIRPLTPGLWPALEDLFDTKGPCSRCWCMYWRIGAAYRKHPPEENKAAFHQIVEAGPPPGLLAFINNQAVGWCQLTPREALPHLDRERRPKRIDQESLWSISCFYIRIGFRKQGVTSALIAAALHATKAAHASALEAYPLDAEKTPSASSTGYVTTFARAGFEIIASQAPPRPIMRHNLKNIAPFAVNKARRQ
jgi:GNAT superfamily N-acetyltransferase